MKAMITKLLTITLLCWALSAMLPAQSKSDQIFQTLKCSDSDYKEVNDAITAFHHSGPDSFKSLTTKQMGMLSAKTMICRENLVSEGEKRGVILLDQAPPTVLVSMINMYELDLNLQMAVDKIDRLRSEQLVKNLLDDEQKVLDDLKQSNAELAACRKRCKQ